MQTKPEDTQPGCLMSTWPYGKQSKVASYSHRIPNKPQLGHKVRRPFCSAFLVFSSIQHIFSVENWKCVTGMQGIRRGQEDSPYTNLGLYFPLRVTKIHVCLLWILLPRLCLFLGIWWHNAKWWEPLCAWLRCESQIWWEKTPLKEDHVALLALIRKRSTSLLEQPPQSREDNWGSPRDEKHWMWMWTQKPDALNWPNLYRI